MGRNLLNEATLITELAAQLVERTILSVPAATRTGLSVLLAESAIKAADQALNLLCFSHSLQSVSSMFADATLLHMGFRFVLASTTNPAR